MKFITVQPNNIKTSESKGFTLIELIIVIGVLGVLAAVLLIAIDPVEQLRRGRDAGRISSVTQLGRAVQQYIAAQGVGTYPCVGVAPCAFTAANWMDILVISGDIKQAIPNPNPVTPSTAVGQSIENNFSYIPFAGNTDGAIWVGVDSNTYKNKASCTAAGKFTAATYVFSKGGTGIDCLTNAATAPTAADTLY